MDCKDLMIGDWVVLKSNGVQPDTKIRITELSTDGGFVDDCDNLIGYEELYPIPLTEEILVKNGFERCDYNNKYFIIDDVIDLITPKWRGGTEYYACAWYQDEFDDLVQHIEICKCAYVHQLQRLLNLCNIDKEIIL